MNFQLNSNGLSTILYPLLCVGNLFNFYWLYTCVKGDFCMYHMIYNLSWIYVDISEVENISVARGPSLEEVTLEPADTEELDKFLNEGNTAEEAS